MSFERLRERTDELELLISGLTLFALLSVPSWLLQHLETIYNQIPFGLLIAASIAVPMLVAICYTLAFGFVLHLCVRACWVGLIGLKAVYPGGVNWTRAHTLGPLTRERLQASMRPIDHSIDRSDRLASVLFSMNLLAGLSLLWIGLSATAVFIAAGLIGAQVGEPNRYVQWAINRYFELLLASVVLLWLFDRVLARRAARLCGLRLYRGWVWLLERVVRVYFPGRLLATLRLTLQTNTWPRSFAFGYLVLVMQAPMAGAQYFQRSAGFDPYGTQRFVGQADVAARSAHYEDQRIARDRRRGPPLIPSAVIETGWLPLFLPYQPLRDDQLLTLRCPERVNTVPGEPPVDGEARARATAACLGRIWEVLVNGRAVPLDGFFATERADLGYRGLAGFIDLRGETPGPQWLTVIWRPEPDREDLKNDMLAASSIHYAIPFLWSPEAAVEFSSPTASPEP